jgi:hypothetical protein
MKQLWIAAVVALAGCGTVQVDAQEQGKAGEATQSLVQPVELELANLDPQVAAVTAQLQASCPWCGLSVTTYDVLQPTAGTVPLSGVTTALLDILANEDRLDWTPINQVTPRSQVVGMLDYKGIGALLPAIEQNVPVNGEGYEIQGFYWKYPTAPDYCSGELIYALVFSQARQVVTVRFDYSHDC